MSNIRKLLGVCRTCHRQPKHEKKYVGKSHEPPPYSLDNSRLSSQVPVRPQPCFPPVFAKRHKTLEAELVVFIQILGR